MYSGDLMMAHPHITIDVLQDAGDQLAEPSGEIQQHKTAPTRPPDTVYLQRVKDAATHLNVPNEPSCASLLPRNDASKPLLHPGNESGLVDEMQCQPTDVNAARSEPVTMMQHTAPHLSSGQNVPCELPHTSQDIQCSITARQSFNNHEIRHTLVLPQDRGPSLAHFYRDVMNTLMGLSDRVSAMVNRNDVVQIEVTGPITAHHVTFTVDEGGGNIMREFETFLDNLVQSNGDVSSTERLEFVIQTVQDPRGGAGGKRKADKTLDSELINKKRRHLYVVNNRDDQLCFSISLACVSEPTLTHSEALLRGRELQYRAGLSEHTAVSFSDVHKFEEILNRKIVVFYRSEGDRVLRKFQTDFSDRSRTVFLLLFQQHYYGIKNLKGFIGTRDVCHYCFSPINHKHSHYCEGSCAVCTDPSCMLGASAPLRCTDCYRTCRNQDCFDRHKLPVVRPKAKVSASICDQIKKCPKCEQHYTQSFTSGKTHVCRGVKCPMCGVTLPDNSAPRDHRCYIPGCAVDEGIHEKVVYYDIETYLHDKQTHVPFVICTKSSTGCEWSSYGPDCIREFIREIRRPAFKNYTFIAHNARGFDSYLVMNALTELGVTPQIVMQGCKILSFTEPDYNLRFIDSLSFLGMKLSQMPAALGFSDQSKGYFPHRFSSLKHLNYIGCFPPPCDYRVDTMTPAEQEKFHSWYRVASRGAFDFKKEALFYCRKDVEILYQGCRRFRDEFFSDTQVDPFNLANVASACMKVFQSNHLKPDTLAIPSPTNYSYQCKPFSSASIMWLEYVARSRNIHVQHALNGGEKKIGPYYLNGYAEVSGRKIGLDFKSCEHHGCVSCRLPTAVSPLARVPYGELYAAAMERDRILRTEYGLHLEVIWEHEWDQMMKTSPGVIQFSHTYQEPEPLAPSEALFGGRTCAVRLSFSAGPDETIEYQDVCSLYPFVQKTKSFPIGHPVIIRENFSDPTNYYGFIKAVISPPRGLFFPILPFETDKGKLVFTLCRTCALQNNQDDSCAHSDAERALTGVWVSEEIKEALKYGYRIDKIIEVWHFAEHSDKAFAEYIVSFLKKKQEASGYPDDAPSDEDRLKYIRDWKENQGVELDPSKIEVNPAKRQVAEICLKSLWGNFAQKNDQTQTTLVHQPQEFFDFMFSGKFHVRYFNFLNPEMAMIQWKYNKKCIIPPNKTTNVFIAAFTTSYARLELLRYLHQLQERVLYMDTDSIIYVVQRGQTALKTGNYLGDLTNELPPGDSIQEFAAVGPKSYAYQTRHTKKVVLKAKGITQSLESCGRVNFQTMTQLVAGERGTVLEAPQNSIKRDENGFRLRNQFKVVYDKRRLFTDGTTLPFGY